MKQEIKLNHAEMTSTANMHKKMIEAVAETLSLHDGNDKERDFYMTTTALAITICNLFLTFRIDKHKQYFDDLYEVVIQMYPKVKSMASGMHYKNGEKISEGMIN